MMPDELEAMMAYAQEQNPELLRHLADLGIPPLSYLELERFRQVVEDGKKENARLLRVRSVLVIAAKHGGFLSEILLISATCRLLY
jgi:hypothetical protein